MSNASTFLCFDSISFVCLLLTQLQIIDDALNLARYSYLSYKNALSVVHYLENEIDYAPWKAAFTNFNFILSRFKINEVSIFEVNT